jgi:DNA mismatch endonuclease (patch repair protein)
MKANKARDTKPELAVRRILWGAGIRGYRINWKKAPGTPDICFPGKCIAIFVNGCFWHRCPKCASRLPKTNAAFWKKKFELNVARDKAKIKALKKLDWLTLTVWECEIKKSHTEVLKRVTNLLVQRVKS